MEARAIPKHRDSDFSHGCFWHTTRISHPAAYRVSRRPTSAMSRAVQIKNYSDLWVSIYDHNQKSAEIGIWCFQWTTISLLPWHPTALRKQRKTQFARICQWVTQGRDVKLRQLIRNFLTTSAKQWQKPFPLCVAHSDLYFELIWAKVQVAMSCADVFDYRIETEGSMADNLSASCCRMLHIGLRQLCKKVMWPTLCNCASMQNLTGWDRVPTTGEKKTHQSAILPEETSFQISTCLLVFHECLSIVLPHVFFCTCTELLSINKKYTVL